MLRLILLTLILAFVSALPYATKAQDAESDITHFIVEFKDGSSAEIGISKKPRITNCGDCLSVEYEAIKADYQWGEVDRFRFAKHVPSDVKAIEATGTEISLDREYIVFRGFTPGATVKAVALDGRAAYSVTVGDDGSALVSLSSLTSGIYIFSAENKSFKILIR